ncbi:DNA-binding protein [Mesobacillus maritimus]|uniref:DNA-binding protein n=1 Tax=Mesobacillus maritimus TaxID=1643336 RepID=UPI00203F9972|nr:DNA-binding protein [Mesobacillus maritimus]MCM3586689.1 DNA-binding protein [Mesobacillus maritimus]MCM3668557.1 DNA-binding protein [Mesobacillus maritimus]
MDSIWLALGIAAAGYFIGEGLKNFKNPEAQSLTGSFDFDDDHELIKDSNVHHFMGITKEDAKVLLKEHPDVPHVLINGKIYYPKNKLKQWLLDIGK